MSKSRMSIFEADPAEQDLDLSGFAPKPPRPAPAPQALDEITAGSKFRSREAARPAVQPESLQQPAHQAPDLPSGRRAPRLYRTGRNSTVSIKTTPAAADEFYRLADQAGWKVGETFERAVAALRKELERGGDS